MTTLLIDGDTFVYRYAAIAVEHVDWGNGLWVSFANEHKATYLMEQGLEEIQASLQATQVQVALSSPTCFRKEIDPTYKANRKKREPLLLYKALRLAMERKFPVHIWTNLEADDVLGILATDPAQQDAIIVSIDKDLKQIPGKHFNPDHSEVGIQEVTSWQGELAFYAQVLSGDPTDNYPGCPKIGPVTAAKILQGATTSEDCWWRVLKTYAKAGILDEADVLRQARLARLLRHGELSAAQGPTLWMPPTPRHF